MKKKHIFLGFLALALSFSVFGNNYRVDDKQLDAIFNNGTEISLVDFNFISPGTSSLASITKVEASNEAIISWLICWVVGEFGIHRHYLGTKPSMWAIYTFTVCGIFGIVTDKEQQLGQASGSARRTTEAPDRQRAGAVSRAAPLCGPGLNHLTDRLERWPGGNTIAVEKPIADIIVINRTIARPGPLYPVHKGFTESDGKRVPGPIRLGLVRITLVPAAVRAPLFGHSGIIIQSAIGQFRQKQLFSERAVIVQAVRKQAEIDRGKHHTVVILEADGVRIVSGSRQSLQELRR